MGKLTGCISYITSLSVKNNLKFKIAAAVLNEQNRVMSWSYNSYIKTHPLQDFYAKQKGDSHKKFLHAEIGALIKCKVEPYTLMVIRTRKDGSLANSTPCPICRLACMEAGVRKLIYSTSEGSVIEEDLKNNNERKLK
jgi:deoxycytidylate deaminase